jgi:hypothetical protein
MLIIMQAPNGANPKPWTGRYARFPAPTDCLGAGHSDRRKALLLRVARAQTLNPTPRLK